PLPAPFDLLNEELVNETIYKKKVMLKKVRDLFEVNPMLGHRGVRLGMSYPEIYRMQIRSILEATAACIKKRIPIEPQIMVPQVITSQELKKVKQMVDDIQQTVESEYRVDLNFKFGTMIETVRACTRAGHLAETAEFFSFGTNDLTQATFSFSREDAENKFLPLYNDAELLQDNPFEVLDIRGVGELMKLTVKLGRETRPALSIGICGEQGGHPKSIRFCHNIKLNYVSCSAPRIPIARLATAHAKLLEQEEIL
ncbi:MAG: putative PEP-binding protein, partial [Methylococcaceae bacterium]